jgi:nucleoside-diphosphate-sugar epimerase
MLKILVTGGSGFIGTNLIDLLEKNHVKIINYDINPPKNFNHKSYWSQVNILDRDLLINQLNFDKPDYIVHLAARTDLNEKYSVDGYSANIEGVRNIMDGASGLHNLNRIIIASSMLVCKLGYIPKSFDDYAPNSYYGESKVLTEKIVKEYNLNWTIVRPTSIWGPWFGEPYKNFFELVINGFYFNIPLKDASTKTYGYVETTCKQIYSLMLNDSKLVKHNYFYLGNLPPINITNWATRIRKLNNQSRLLTLPKWLLIFVAKIGDFMKFKLGIYKFPMSSFRFKNMTNDNVIMDIERTIEVTQIGKESYFDNEIITTLNWLKQNKNKK